MTLFASQEEMDLVPIIESAPGTPKRKRDMSKDERASIRKSKKREKRLVIRTLDEGKAVGDETAPAIETS